MPCHESPARNGKVGGSHGRSYGESTTHAGGSALATLIAGAGVPRSAVLSSGGFPAATSVSTTRIAPLKNGSEVTTRERSPTGSAVSKRDKAGR
jgi:hypothetical protein